MFYVLDFHSHRFTTCETVEKVNEKLKQLQDSGVADAAGGKGGVK